MALRPVTWDAPQAVLGGTRSIASSSRGRRHDVPLGRRAEDDGPAPSLVTTDSAGHLAATSFNPQDIGNLQNSVNALNGNVATLNSSVAALAKHPY